MQSVKQECIKCYFLSLLYDPTWDWTPISQITGKHSTHYANEPVNIYIYTWKNSSWWLRDQKNMVDVAKSYIPTFIAPVSGDKQGLFYVHIKCNILKSDSYVYEKIS